MAQYVLGSLLDFTRDPGPQANPDAWRYIEDGGLRIENGKITAHGERKAIMAGIDDRDSLHDFRGHLILPGFVDTHIHYTQMDVIASFGRQLLDWLNDYTFPAERAFADPKHASQVAEFFLATLLSHGTTTAAVYASVHRQSVEALFAVAERRGCRIICGKVMMDRNCPDYLRDDVSGAERDSRELIERWRGKGRLGYALTPRFAPTSTPEQLAMVGRLYREIPDLWVQTHLAENIDEVAWVARLFPEARSYLDVYDRHGLLGPRTILGHCLHLDETDRARMAETGAAIAFCPTSNLFIGSGFFDLAAADRHAIGVGLASDVGGGTSYSMLTTLSEAYKVLMTRGQRLNPWRGFYLATLGGARALRLDDHIGNFDVGKEADFVVIDWAGTPVLKRRTEVSRSLEERLFALMMLGDDRAIRATFTLGQPAASRA
jgi:guanine deaminase